ncbi:MAG TPA: Rieske 2Fe-2S domain-containing protein [Candidatus Limnocylindria bacterium]|nr:Rieske 2Fe-2S domain-containing protein [Candidatus Limnocylindria bacterium]
MSDAPRVMEIPAGLTAVGVADTDFEALADLADLPPGTTLRVSRGDLDLLLVNSDGGICVIDDRCPHMSAPLSLGTLEDCVIGCPLHKGKFNLCDGGIVQFPTTGGLDADGGYHAPWTPPEAPVKAEPTDLKAMARAATRVRRLRYYPVRVLDGHIEVRLPPQG